MIHESHDNDHATGIKILRDKCVIVPIIRVSADSVMVKHTGRTIPHTDQPLGRRNEIAQVSHVQVGINEMVSFH